MVRTGKGADGTRGEGTSPRTNSGAARGAAGLYSHLVRPVNNSPDQQRAAWFVAGSYEANAQHPVWRAAALLKEEGSSSAAWKASYLPLCLGF